MPLYLHGDKIQSHMQKLKTTMKNINQQYPNYKKKEHEHNKNTKILQLKKHYQNLYNNLNPNHVKTKVEKEQEKLKKKLKANVYTLEESEEIAEETLYKLTTQPHHKRLNITNTTLDTSNTTLHSTNTTLDSSNTTLDSSNTTLDPKTKKKQKWNNLFDGISTKHQIKNFINFLCEYDMEYAFNNKYIHNQPDSKTLYI